MKLIKKLLSWLDQHLMELVAGFLLVFIPLYPKWPLSDILPGYIVRLRLEDVLIALALIIFLIQVLRRKVKLKDNPLTLPILVYLGIGLLSSLSALFVTRTVPLERIHVAKLFLHWGRRVEYMSLAFIFFSAVKTSRQVKRIVAIVSMVAVMTFLYGLGQKYLQWPVYSTMNREFAKGWRLVLTQHARVPSTFAGHYDFAAFNVIVLSIVGSLVFYKKNRLSKTFLLIFTASFFSLLLTASRTSFIAYLVALTAVFIGLSLKRGFAWALGRWAGLIAVSLVIMLFFGDLSQRFAHFFKLDQIKEYVAYEILHLDTLEFKPKPKDQDELALVYTETDTPPVPVEKDTDGQEGLPPDVYEDINLAFPEATLSGDPGVASLAATPRSYSTTAYAFGLSSAIRFDALWPRAFEGFKRNPLLGSGYSTLVKSQPTQFTEAESTDNDFLRALGETGILGFLSFFAILGFALYSLVKNQNSLSKEPFLLALAIGIGGAIIGMLVNGLYIDVFEASKVSYIFWAMMGLLFACIDVVSRKA